MTIKRKGSRGRRGAPDLPALSREMIVKSALDYIDEDGLETFSLRNLNTRLGVYPTAIYWYVPSRNELLAQIVSLVLVDVLPARRRRAWQNYIRDLFENYRAAVRAHPNVAPLIGTQLVSNVHMDGVLDQLRGDGQPQSRGLVAIAGLCRSGIARPRHHAHRRTVRDGNGHGSLPLHRFVPRGRPTARALACGNAVR